MLSIAIRIAQRMGLDSESVNAKCHALDAEMRRRLWWSLVLFDTRICDLARYRSMTLVPTWDCRPPSNVSDFDLQPEIKDPPAVQGTPTEALFAVVRGEMGDYVRHSTFYLELTNPALKTVVKNSHCGHVPEGGELKTIEKVIEDKYIRFCIPGNPLHFMTIWTAQGQLAKNCLLESYSNLARSPTQQTDAERNADMNYALITLECDTKLITSPLVKGYLWHIQFHFPFPAYIHLTQELRRRPVGDHSQKYWEAMSNNYQARLALLGENDTPFFKVFARTVLQAWEAREALSEQCKDPLAPPQLISDIRQKLARLPQEVLEANAGQPSDALALSLDDLSRSMPTDSIGRDMLYGTGWPSYEGLGTGIGEIALDVDADHFDWNAMDWNQMLDRGR